MLFALTIIDETTLLARLQHGQRTWDIRLGKGHWTANDYRAHWGFTSYMLLDSWRTKFLILDARPKGSLQPCRALRVSRIADRFHIHDVLIAAPIKVGGYEGESLIEWLNRPQTPMLASARVGHGPAREDRIDEFIVEHADFERWHFEELDPSMPETHRSVHELTTIGDWA